MIRKLNKMKALVAGLLSAFMVLGAVAIAPMQVQADTVNHTVTVSRVGNGIAEAHTDIAAAGELVIITAYPAAGADFSEWRVIAGNTTIANPTSRSAAFIMPNENVQVEAVFTGGHGTGGVQLATPIGLTVDANNRLHWNAVPNAWSYRVYNGNTFIAYAETNFWQINLNLFPQGTVVNFVIVAEAPPSLTSPRSAAFQWTSIDGTMPTPNITVTQAGLLTWTGHGPQFVRVYRGGTVLHITETAVTQVDLSNLNIGIGSQSISIRFLAANGDVASNLSNVVTVNLTGQLPAPTNVAVSGATLTWTAVPNAVGYRIYVGGTARTTGQTITGTNFNLAALNLASGNHNIQVRALGNGTTTQNSGLSTGVNFTPGAVAVPTNVNISGTTLSWTAVSNAVGYRVYIDGTARTTGTEITTTSFNLATLNLAVGTHRVQVRALGNGTTTHDSGLSTEVEFVMQIQTLEAPANVNLQGNVLHWNAVPGTRGYVIYVGGVVHSAPTTATHFALGALSLPAGTHTVQVRALGDNGATLDSPLSTIVTFTVGAILPPGEQPSLWARDMVETAVNAGLVPAHLRSQFAQATTRAEFAALATALYETVMGYQIMGRMHFNDTNDVNVQKMGYMGVVLGIGYGDFAPYSPLTREQAATMIARLADAMQRPLPMVAAAFPDNAAIAPWAIVQVGQMQGSGIMVGADGGMFMPQGPYTREQSIVTLLRLFNIVTR